MFTSVAPRQDVVYVELLRQESSWPQCHYFQTLVLRVELQLYSQKLGLVYASVLVYSIRTFRMFVGRNYLYLCAAVWSERFFYKLSKSWYNYPVTFEHFRAIQRQKLSDILVSLANDVNNTVFDLIGLIIFLRMR